MGSSYKLDRHAAERLPVQARGESDTFWRQRLHATRERGSTIPKVLGEAAWQGYDADGHGEQSCARLHQRGGFGLAELGYYLARALDEGRIRVEIVAVRAQEGNGDDDRT